MRYRPAGKNFPRCLGLVCIALLAAVPAVLFWPVDALVMRDDDGRVVFRAAMPPGSGFETRYIHSVQLGPVEDAYVVRDGLILQWRSRVQSQGAGLPFLALERGRAYLDPPWLVFEGAIFSAAGFAMRVGNEILGRNHMRIRGEAWQPLYRRLSGRRVHLAASRCALRRLCPPFSFHAL